MSLLIITVNEAMGQSKKSEADSLAKILAEKLSVSSERAAQVQEAYGSYAADIRRVMSDTKLKGKERQRELRHYMGLRRHKIDSLVSPEQKGMISNLDGTLLEEEKARRAAIEQEQERRLNVVPHKRGSVPAKHKKTAN